MKPLATVMGIDLAALDKAPPPPNRACPGALLHLNRDEYDAYRRAGEVFTTTRAELPEDERGSARIVCRNEILLKRGCTGRLIEFALCASCTEVETKYRDALRSLAEATRAAR